MAEKLGARIKLLKDANGIFGVGVQVLPEKWQHLKPILTRVNDDAVALDAALQMIQRKLFARVS